MQFEKYETFYSVTTSVGTYHLDQYNAQRPTHSATGGWERQTRRLSS